MSLDIVGFVRKWNASSLTEKSGAQTHFRDLCDALGVAHPNEEDVVGASYIYEKRVSKAGTGEQGFADVWKRGYFAWEYKSKGGDLKKAYKQLNEYHEALENPPLLVVCDFVRFEVHTKFENLPSRTYAFTLDDLLNDRDTATCALPPLEVLRYVFGDYNQLRPTFTAERVTRATALDFLRLARQLDLERAIERDSATPQHIARFLMRLVFCLFADSVDLLPNHTFRRFVENDRFSPINFNRKLPGLFQAMSEDRSFFGVENIPYFNGGLFTDNSTIELNQADLGLLHSAAQHDWSHIEPAIFGTLFETALNQEKRDQLRRSGQTDVQAVGVHYTSPDDILLLVEPVVMQPLRRRWEAVKTSILAALEQEQAEEAADARASAVPRGLRPNRPAQDILQTWAAELAAVRILDPACGSGNFLYVALKRLLDLWHESRVFGSQHDLKLESESMPSPLQLFGIELNFYAHEIASLSVWIGFLQWKHDHGIKDTQSPLLQKLDNIQHADAILRHDADDKPYEPEWPAVDYIVSNPPFLGGTQMRKQLGDKYCNELRKVYEGRVKGAADLVVYWFEKSREMSERDHNLRVGLLATQGIRGGANQFTLSRILAHGKIFWAISDRNWTLEGATVHVSMIAFTNGDVDSFCLDGEIVRGISADLTSGIDTTKAEPLSENDNICFEGTKKHGAFDITQQIADKMLNAPLNPNGRPNSDVVTPWINALDITRRPRHMYIIDFGTSRSVADAALYEYPFQFVKQHVYPERQTNRREARKTRWWLHGETNPGMRARLQNLPRFIGTPRVSKYRIFVWLTQGTLPDSATCVFARSDDYFIGVLHSSSHEEWARKMGTQLREVESGFRYTPKSTFDTFPFPWPPGKEPAEVDSPIVRAIADAARKLVRLRDAWLNPPDISEADLKDRTLTKLYNARAEGKADWLANAHRTLDEAVFAAYGWPSNLTDQEILSRLLALNHQRAALQSV
jgi:type II restriction/modification system DNA methylase subunit YeeA